MSQIVARPTVVKTEFRSDECVVFVSDVHLYFDGSEYLTVFLRFLSEIVRGARALFIHGDLFDFFVGPRQGRLDFYRPLFDSLRQLVLTGIPVTVLHGNRDFLMGQEFEEQGVVVVSEDLDLLLGTQRVHLSHGDEFCIHDRSYQFWARGVLRARPIAWTVRHLPVGFALWLARRYRGVSKRKMKRHEGGGRLPTILEGVTNFLAKNPRDHVICGHIHHLARTEISNSNGTSCLWTTGAWEEGPNYILWKDGTLRMERFPEQIPPKLSAIQALQQ